MTSRKHLVSLSAVLIVALAASLASAATIDSTTQGSWIGTYGSQGYILTAYNGASGTLSSPAATANDVASLPSYISSYGYSSTTDQYVWANPAYNPNPAPYAPVTSVLQNPGGGNPVAATAFNDGNFSLTLDLANAERFQLAVYALDYDKYNGRDITVSVGSDSAHLDAATGYQLGDYAVFNVNALAGPLTINIQQNAAGISNSTISGIFFDKGVVTPEPSSLILCGLGALGLVVAARRRKSA